MAPEQDRSEPVDARSDLYALGVTMREMLGGHPDPEAGEWELVRRLVDASPERRPESAEDVRQTLEMLLESLGTARRGRLERGSLGRGDAPPLPASLAGSQRRPFVSRERELAQLEHDWRAAAGAKRRLVVIRGEPGIGKTRLAAHFAAQARARGSSVLHGKCYEQAAVPYQPFVDALRHIAANSVAPFPEGEAAALQHIVPELGHGHRRATTTRDAQLGPTRLLEAVTSCLYRFARRRPLVLVIDDLQWADRPTFQLLLHVLRHPAEGGILILGTLQTPHARLPEPVGSVVTDLTREGLLRRVDLSGLDSDGIRALLAADRRVRPSVDLVRVLADVTDGNPFYVEEVVRDIRDRRRAGDDDAVRTVGLPEGVKEVIARRIARLTAASIEVLQIASVLGREFSLDLLEAVLEARGDAVILALEEAEEMGLVAGFRSGSDTSRSATGWCATPSTAASRPRRGRAGTAARLRCSRATPATAPPPCWLSMRSSQDGARLRSVPWSTRSRPPDRPPRCTRTVRRRRIRTGRARPGDVGKRA